MRRLRHSSGVQGLSLLEILVAAGLMCFLAIIFTYVMRQMTGIRSHIESESDKLGLRSRLLAQTHCTNTADPTNMTCDGGLIDLRDKDNNVLVSKSGTGTKIGKWTLRAYCDALANSIVVTAAQPRPGALLTSTNPQDYVKEQFTGKSLSHESPGAKVIGLERQLCRTKIAPGMPPPPPPDSVIPLGVTLRSTGSEPNVDCDGSYKSGSSEPCPVDRKLVGGGVKCLGPEGAGSKELNASYPDFANRVWKGTCCDAARIEVFAICSK